MWVEVQPGDTLRVDDEFLSTSGTWQKCPCPGVVFEGASGQVQWRRRIAGFPLVGDGFRYVLSEATKYFSSEASVVDFPGHAPWVDAVLFCLNEAGDILVEVSYVTGHLESLHLKMHIRQVGVPSRGSGHYEITFTENER